jgi:tetratricopeptide (TPR) repeat protein
LFLSLIHRNFPPFRFVRLGSLFITSPILLATLPWIKAFSDAWGLRQNKDFTAALQNAETAASIDPQFIDAQRVLGRIVQDQGRNAEAAIHYNQALAIARTMEPSTQEQPVNWITQRLAEISKPTSQGKRYAAAM